MKKALATVLAIIALVALCACGSGNNDAKRNEAFANLIADYEATYGSGEVVSSGLSYVLGVAYTELVDFGDGNPRLVLAYLDESRMQYSYPLPEDYVIEVWSWDGRSKEPLSFFTLSPSRSNGGFGWISYAAVNDKPGILTDIWQMTDDHATLITSQALYGPAQDGSFGSAISAWECVTTDPYTSYSSSVYSYTVDGASVDYDTYAAADLNSHVTIENLYLVAGGKDLSGMLDCVARTKSFLAGEQTEGGIRDLKAEAAAALEIALASRTFSTPYYTITIPLSEPEPSFRYDGPELNIVQPEQNLGLGCETSVDFTGDGYAEFNVACFTGWGPEGTFYRVQLGPVPGEDGWYVWLYQPFRTGNEPDLTGKYAQYVTIN